MVDVIRAAVREVLSPIMWAELFSIALFLAAFAVWAALASGA